jgi:hypothetical protein
MPSLVSLRIYDLPLLVREFEEDELPSARYVKVRNRHTKHVTPKKSLKLIDLEETSELFDRSGFKKTRIFGIHQIDYVDPSKYIATLESPQSLFRINLESELAEIVVKETKEEMMRAKTGKGFKVTTCYILAYGQKA